MPRTKHMHNKRRSNMATALKHMERSHRSHRQNTIPVAMFANKAAVRETKKATKERMNIFQKIIHRMQNK